MRSPSGFDRPLAKNRHYFNAVAIAAIWSVVSVLSDFMMDRFAIPFDIAAALAPRLFDDAKEPWQPEQACP